MNWNFSKTGITTEQVDNLSSKLDIDPLLAKILLNRGLSQDEARVIVKDIHEGIQDPYLLTNANEAADIIVKYCKNTNSEIHIFADYDVDGLTSGYIMTSALQEVSKGIVMSHYPERKDGYGINVDFCNRMIEIKNSGKDVLVMTVDNGITKVEEIELLKANGLEVIITDHHSAQEEVPDCLIVNPHNHNQEETYKHLAGCGVAFKVAQIVQEKLNTYKMMKYTSYVAIGTIADMMPMHSENISFIQYGLEVINSEDCPRGLKQFKSFIGKDKLTATDIAWDLSPRLNSCGRLGDIMKATKMFFVENLDEDQIYDAIYDIEKMNIERKSYSDKAKRLLKKQDFSKDKICILNAKDYPEGVVGIIAGQLANIENKPAIVLVEKEDGTLAGSARSSHGLNLQELFTVQREKGNIIDFGGHAGAAGVTVDKNKVDELLKDLNDSIEIAEESLDMSEEELIIDALIAIDNINNSTYELINTIPYDNRTFKAPMFALTDVEVVKISNSKNNPNNICFTVKDSNNTTKQLWAWGMNDKYKELGKPKEMHIAGEIVKDFRNPKYCTLKIIDFIGA